MPYQDLTVENIRTYLFEKTCIFPKGAVLSVYEYKHEDGDGHVNHLYKVQDPTGKTVMLKQAKPYLFILGENGTSIPVDRNRIEVTAFRINEAIMPECLPKLLHVDHENHLFIQEFCPEPLMRIQLGRGMPCGHLVQKLGEYLAKTSFYTSEIFMDQIEHKSLITHFSNGQMRQILEKLLFEVDSVLGEANQAGSEDENLVRVLYRDKALRLSLMQLRDAYIKKTDCLLHGDLHTSNIMMGANTIKVFDLEYAHVGNFATDMGYFAGNFIYPYIAWQYRQEVSLAERQQQQAQMLTLIKVLTNRYFETFKKCWQQDAKPLYQELPEYFHTLFADFIPQMCGLMGAQALLRTKRSSYQLLDFEFIQNESDKRAAQIQGAVIGTELIKQCQNMSTIEDVINLIQSTSVAFSQTTRGKELF